MACSGAVQCCGYCGTNCGLFRMELWHFRLLFFPYTKTYLFGSSNDVVWCHKATIPCETATICLRKKPVCLAPLTMSFSVIRWAVLGFFALKRKPYFSLLFDANHLTLSSQLRFWPICGTPVEFPANPQSEILANCSVVSILITSFGACTLDIKEGPMFCYVCVSML